jgi:hypothetical protein
MKKRRMEIHLDPDLSKWLDEVSKKPGASKSSIVSAAVKEYLDHGARAYVDPAIMTRMDRLSRQAERITRNQEVLLETMGMYVEYDLGISGRMLPESERAAARAIGHERFVKFIEHVARRLASTKNLTHDLVDELELDLAAGDAEAALSVGKKPN